MVEVTDSDRTAAAAYMKLVGSKRWSQEGILSGGCDNTSIVQAFATHREAAAKAERDRIVSWFRATQAAAMKQGKLEASAAMEGFADALEGEQHVD